ncbi:hypothetical protein [Salinicola tamaricis]|uniref:hypothetical protein n=1 Tax=Salinicola tamaricis TaxID=1771309 RepID=UPI001F5C663F|nr:hypothetical protein [Salinicola tamaricis]
MSDHDRDLLGLARQLAEARGGAEAGVAVVAVTFQAEVAGLEEAGADRRVDLSSRVDADSYAPEARLAALAAVETTLAPMHWIFADDFPGGGDLGRRLAARLALASTAGGDARHVQRPGCGSSPMARPSPAPVTARTFSARWRGCAGAAGVRSRSAETQHAATLLDLDALGHDVSASDERSAPGVADLGRVAVDPQQIPLAQAPFILSAGRGVSDWERLPSRRQGAGCQRGRLAGGRR